MLRKIFVVICLCCFCFAATAFADVPDPGGRPRPRPQPFPEMTFRVESLSYHNADEFSDKMAVDLVYYAPRHSELTYQVNAFDGVFYEGADTCGSGRGVITVYFPKLKGDGEWLQSELKLDCRLNVQETAFGLKQTTQDIYRQTEEVVFLIQNKDGVCEINQK